MADQIDDLTKKPNESSALMTAALIVLVIFTVATIGGIVYIWSTNPEKPTQEQQAERDQEIRNQIILVFQPVYDDMQAHPDAYDAEQINMTAEILKMAKDGASMQELREKTDAYSAYTQKLSGLGKSPDIDWSSGQPVIRLNKPASPDKTQEDLDEEIRQQIIVLYGPVFVDMRDHPENYHADQIKLLSEVMKAAQQKAPIEILKEKTEAYTLFISSPDTTLPTTSPKSLTDGPEP